MPPPLAARDPVSLFPLEPRSLLSDAPFRIDAFAPVGVPAHAEIFDVLTTRTTVSQSGQSPPSPSLLNLEFHLSRDQTWGNADDIMLVRRQGTSAPAPADMGRTALAFDWLLQVPFRWRGRTSTTGLYRILARASEDFSDFSPPIAETPRLIHLSVPPDALSTRPIAFSLSALNQPIIAGDTTPSAANGTLFPTIGGDQPAVSRTYTITNTGAAPLFFSRLLFGNLSDGRAAREFEIAREPDRFIPVGRSTTFTLRLNPRWSGHFNADISIITAENGPGAPNFTFTIAGTVLDAPSPSVTRITVPDAPPGVISYRLINAGTRTLRIFGTSIVNRQFFSNVEHFVVLPHGPVRPGHSITFSLYAPSTGFVVHLFTNAGSGEFTFA